MSASEKRIAVVPGSFDPITFGHIDIVRRAAEQYDEVYVAVMINDQKKYLFTLSQRKQIAEAALEGIEGVQVISSDGMLWELAKRLGACAIVKGYRNEIDLSYEKSMAEYNHAHYPAAETILLPSTEEYLDLSSTVVRERISARMSLQGYLPQRAIDEIYKIIPRSL